MKYMSLFSGIGGFEIAIHNIFPDAVCVGFSEVDKHAIAVYKHHFPTHENMGSVTDITEKQIKKIIKHNGGIDLIIGGFPCQNLSSMAKMTHGNSDGLEGPKSSLFYSMIQIIKWIKKYNRVQLHLLAENNASMSNANKKLITDTFEGVFEHVWMTKLNGADFGVQNRRRLYWTTFEVELDGIVCNQTWDDILEPLEKCESLSEKNIFTGNKKYQRTRDSGMFIEVIKHIGQKYKFQVTRNEQCISRWQMGFHSDTGNKNNICYSYPYGKSRTFIRVGGIASFLIDRRVSDEEFIVRHFLPVEIERLFWIPEGWVSEMCSKTRCSLLLGNTVVVKVIEFIFNSFIKKAPTTVT
jgi:DNA-cytosine methyltransferase